MIRRPNAAYAVGTGFGAELFVGSISTSRTELARGFALVCGSLL